eukprot:2538640-Rhodomonas_salina.1
MQRKRDPGPGTKSPRCEINDNTPYSGTKESERGLIWAGEMHLGLAAVVFLVGACRGHVLEAKPDGQLVPERSG